MTKFVLIRHASPDYKKIIGMGFNKYYATSFAPLSGKGKEEATLLASNETLNNSDLIITSPFTRTIETANIISSINNLDVIIEPNLHEWLPDINLKYISDLEYTKRLKQAKLNINGPFETFKDIEKRSFNVLKKYLEYNKIIVVCHKVVIYSLTGKNTKMGGIQEIEIINNKIKVLKK